VTVFSFPYRRERARNGTVIFRPSVSVHLQGVDGEWLPFRLYADAGADLTLMTATDCQSLGYELESGEFRFMGGVCSGLIRTFIHNLPIRLGTEELNCQIAFADKSDLPRLLGRENVFRRFKVCYDDVERVTQFISREE